VLGFRIYDLGRYREPETRTERSELSEAKPETLKI